jgi:hypothetical protein
MQQRAWPPEGSSRRELGVIVRTVLHQRPEAPLADGIERLEEITAGGDTLAVGEWKIWITLKDGRWFGQVECIYGIDGVITIGGELGGHEPPGPVDTDIVEQELGPFPTREDALSAVAVRLLACVALLSGDWEPPAA